MTSSRFKRRVRLSPRAERMDLVSAAWPRTRGVFSNHFAVGRMPFMGGQGRPIRGLGEIAWVHSRSLYVTDLEGHEVEWVCYDGSVG